MAQSEVSFNSEDILKRYPIIDCQLPSAAVSPVLTNLKSIMSMERSYNPRTEKNFTRFDVSNILGSDADPKQYDSRKTADYAREETKGKSKSNESDLKKEAKTDKVQYKNESEDPQFPSYTAMIAQAILSTVEKKLTLGGIYEFIEVQYPGLEKRVKGWRNCVRHNLSLNECFIKLGRSETGRGNDWAIHPSYLESFLRGEYRKRRACAKQRYDLVYIGGPYGYTTADQLMQWANRYQYMQYLNSLTFQCNSEVEKRDNASSFHAAKKSNDRYHPYFQSSRNQSSNCNCCCCLDTCANNGTRKFANEY